MTVLFDLQLLAARDESEWERLYEHVLHPIRESLGYRYHEQMSSPEIDDVWSDALVKALEKIQDVEDREKGKIQPFIPRCRVKHLKPLPRDDARALAEQHLPNNLADRETTARRIVDLANGHPATIVSLARRARRGTLAELRDFDVPRAKIGLAWLVVVPLLALLIVSRWHQDSYWLSLGLLAVSILMRPLFYRSMRSLR